MQVVYIAALPLVKISILLLYNRLFPDRWFRWLSYGIGVFLICWFLAFEPATIWQCKDIAANWDVTSGTDVLSMCIDENTMYNFYSAFNLATDIIVMAMPWPYVYKLQLPLKKKCQLFAVFLLGSL